MGAPVCLTDKYPNMAAFRRVAATTPGIRFEPATVSATDVPARLGMRRAPLLLASSRAVIPLAVGFGRPAIVLPERLLGAIVVSHRSSVVSKSDEHFLTTDS